MLAQSTHGAEMPERFTFHLVRIWQQVNAVNKLLTLYIAEIDSISGVMIRYTFLLEHDSLFEAKMSALFGEAERFDGAGFLSYWAHFRGVIMRMIVVLLLLVSQLAFAGADYQREEKWADEIVPGIVVGDPVYLALKNGHKFLSLYAEAKDARMGLVVIHGLGIHPDWNMVGTLRTQLAEYGYTTLSIQMPVLANDAKAESYQALFPEAAERIGAAVDFLHARGYKKVAIVSHSMGSAMSHMYVEKNQSKLIAWAALGMGQKLDYSGIHIPVLDMYGEHDLSPVMSMVAKRASSLKGNPLSKQVRVPGSDHFYNNHETQMVHEVEIFLDGIK
jgi:pimeloyl-ACP methyl ester carboxylesterase